MLAQYGQTPAREQLRVLSRCITHGQPTSILSIHKDAQLALLFGLLAPERPLRLAQRLCRTTNNGIITVIDHPFGLLQQTHLVILIITSRSEERRVGKEC